MSEELFQFEMNEQNPKDKEELVSKLVKENHILSLVQKGILPKEEIELHPFKLEKWLNQKKLCDGCTGLNHCKQKQKGYVEEIIYEGVLESEYHPCTYLAQKKKDEDYLNHYIYNDLPVGLSTISFETIQLEEEEAAYINAVKEALHACEEEFGRYFYGTMGTGKTYLSICMLNHFAKQNRKVAFVHCPKFQERLNNIPKWESLNIIEPLMRADVVVFDDIGAEEVTNRYCSILLSILDDRNQNHKMTIFTSNEDHKSLQSHYEVGTRGTDLTNAMRIIERIQALSKPVKMVCKDKRILYSTNNQ